MEVGQSSSKVPRKKEQKTTEVFYNGSQQGTMLTRDSESGMFLCGMCDKRCKDPSGIKASLYSRSLQRRAHIHLRNTSRNVIPHLLREIPVHSINNLLIPPCIQYLGKFWLWLLRRLEPCCRNSKTPTVSHWQQEIRPRFPFRNGWVLWTLYQQHPLLLALAGLLIAPLWLQLRWMCAQIINHLQLPRVTFPML